MFIFVWFRLLDLVLGTRKKKGIPGSVYLLSHSCVWFQSCPAMPSMHQKTNRLLDDRRDSHLLLNPSFFLFFFYQGGKTFGYSKIDPFSRSSIEIENDFGEKNFAGGLCFLLFFGFCFVLFSLV